MKKPASSSDAGFFVSVARRGAVVAKGPAGLDLITPISFTIAPTCSAASRRSYGACPELLLVASEEIGEDAERLTYVRA